MGSEEAWQTTVRTWLMKKPQEGSEQGVQEIGLAFCKCVPVAVEGSVDCRWSGMQAGRPTGLPLGRWIGVDTREKGITNDTALLALLPLIDLGRLVEEELYDIHISLWTLYCLIPSLQMWKPTGREVKSLP